MLGRTLKLQLPSVDVVVEPSGRDTSSSSSCARIVIGSPAFPLETLPERVADWQHVMIDGDATSEVVTTTTACFLTTAVGADVLVSAPYAFDARTTKRSVFPSSVPRTVYV